jgi:dTDP-4-dehydrorhamnose reductase
MKILLIGADGQLGTDIQKVMDKKELIPLTVSDLDITKGDQVERVITSHSPDVVVNTAAYHRVDDCERDDALAFAVNSIAVKNLSLSCKRAGAALLHISTDYVFDGEKGSPYTEADVPNPRSAYGISKLAGEFYVRYLLDKYFIIRTSSLFGIAGCLGKGGGNFVETMLEIGREKGAAKVVSDQVVSPTYTLDLAKKIAELVKTEHFGLYHITNKGECSWYGFAKKIFELMGLKVKLESVTSDVYKAPAHRPKYSVLAHKNLERLGIDDLPTWEQALKAYLQERGSRKERPT